MADFIERLREIHDEDINLFIIIQILSHVVDELYKLSFAQSKFVMLEAVSYVILSACDMMLFATTCSNSFQQIQAKEMGLQLSGLCFEHL